MLTGNSVHLLRAHAGRKTPCCLLKDIAQKAGVSVTAVSFALNGKEGISEKTREKILRIVEEEGYTSKKLIQNSQDASLPISLKTEVYR
mgnify:CR=1 FL=1